MRRARLYLCVALLLVAIALAWALWPTSDPVRENFKQIEIGWTKADVIGVLGEPISATWKGEGFLYFWESESGTGLVVVSIETRRVTRTQWTSAEPDPIWLRLWRRVTDWFKPAPPPPVIDVW